jgi:DNA-binding MarR family transcriptional regulator
VSDPTKRAAEPAAGVTRGESADDPAQMSVVYLLRSVAFELNAFGATFASANGLHVTDLRAIVELLDAERAGQPASPGWLGRRLGLGSAAVTAVVDRLERLGHVQRESDPADRRRVRLLVTPAAKDLGWTFFGPLIDGVLAVTRAFDDVELATVRRFLTDVAETVKAHAGGLADATRT